MKLKEIKILQERLASFVHVNSDKTLSVISNLVKKEFGLKNPSYVGVCLFSQFVFTLASQLDIPEQIIADHYDLKNGPRHGHTPAELMDHFEKTEIIYKDKSYKLKIGLEEYQNINDVIKTLQSGQPVVLITGSENTLYDKTTSIEYHNIPDEHKQYLYGTAKREIDKINTGKILHGEIDIDSEYKTKKLDKHEGYHALLMIGYDSHYDLLIGRDNRDSYAYKGYFRIKGKSMQKKFNDFKFFGFYVDDVKITKVKQ